MRIVAFDSKVIRRKNPEFKALLGVGVTVQDYAVFSKEYDKILDEVFKSNNIPRKKRVYKGSELTAIFYGTGVDLIPLLAKRLIPLISFVDIHYSYFIPESTADIKKEGLKIGVFYKQEIKRLSPGEFIDLIEGHFPAICCHTYLKRLQTPIKQEYHIDHCPGIRPSDAMVNVIRHTDTRFLFRGDQVNYAISCADILCRHIDNITFREGIHLNRHLIQNLGLNPECAQTTYIGTKWLNDIKPSHDKVLNISHKYPHPVFHFFLDTAEKGVFGKFSKMIVEKSNLYQQALDKACEMGGSVKFFEPADQEFMTNEDVLICHNEESKKKAEEIIRLGCKATITDFSYFK